MRLANVLGTAFVLASACGPAGPPPTATSQPASAALHVPAVPDDVTIVPFELSKLGEPAVGFILLQAEVDGHRGTYVLDTGSPQIYMNGEYVQPDTTQHGGATHPTLLGKTVIPFFARTLRIGTLVHHFDSTRVDIPLAPGQPASVNALIMPAGQDQRFSQFGRLLTGILGLAALAPFETIVDYDHQRLVLIRLDPTGRRLVPVPAYTPVETLSLVVGQQWFMLPVVAGSRRGAIMIDTGSPFNQLNYSTRQAFGLDLTATGRANPLGEETFLLDSLVVGKHIYKGVEFSAAAGSQPSLVGYPLLRELSHQGAVGFNFRTHQISLYRYH